MCPVRKTVDYQRERAKISAAGCQSHQLPPTRDALRQHVRRANFQAGVWQRSLYAKADVPSPDGHGWLVDEKGKLAIFWMFKQLGLLEP